MLPAITDGEGQGDYTYVGASQRSLNSQETCLSVITSLHYGLYISVSLQIKNI